MLVHDPGGFWVRFFANLLDGLITVIGFGFIGLLIYNRFIVEEVSMLDLLHLLYYMILPIIWQGYTIGKNMLGIRIVRMDGGNVTFVNMLLRHLVGGLVYAFTLGIGVIISAFMVGMRSDKRAIHDFIAGTYVTYEKPENT
ncbi:RDD family protein [Oceanobacillus sp. CAU 1775]